MARRRANNPRAELNQALGQARRIARSIYAGAAIEQSKKLVKYQVARKSINYYAEEYTISAARIFASSLETVLKNIPEELAQTTLKALDALEEATIGNTPEARKDNRDIQKIMVRLAEHVNRDILEQYKMDFGGRSYRENDPQRRSGELEAFLEQKLLANAMGMEMQVSLAPAVGNPSVPHIFRLNYGTESLNGPEKMGERPPKFTVSILPGGESVAATLGGPRRPGFSYPGKAFTYRLSLGPPNMGRPGAIQLYKARDSISGRVTYPGGAESGGRIGGGTFANGRKPSQGIAPSYFIQYGIAGGLQHTPVEFQKLMNKWKQRARQAKVR